MAALPKHVRQQASETYRLFQHTPSHPCLRFKQVWHDPRIDSARIGISYRAVGVIDGETIVWYWVGSHADYDMPLTQTWCSRLVYASFNSFRESHSTPSSPTSSPRIQPRSQTSSIR